MRPTPEDFQDLPTVDDASLEGGGVRREKAEAAGKEPAPPEPPMESPPAFNRQPSKVSLRAHLPVAKSAPEKSEAPASPPKKPVFTKNRPTERIPASSGVAVILPAKTKKETSLPPVRAFKAPVRIHSGEASGASALPTDSWRQRWDKWGGRSLAFSVGIHVLILVAAALIVVHQVMDKQIDFLSGGGTAQGEQASQALLHKIQQKKNPWLKQSMPIRKLAVANTMKNVVLPTEVPDMLDMPQTSMPMSGGMASGGFGLAGAAGGFGKGMGLGAKGGTELGPLFGLNIKSKKLAVVLDVSSSMTPHLERVVKEVDKVAKGSVVVLYFGCGLDAPAKPLVGTKVFRTSTIEFEKFWRMGGATFMETAGYKINTKDPIPSKDLFLQLSRRPQTYFIHNVGVSYTWLALLSDEVRNADGLYWFSDFQDTVVFKQVSIVLENLKRRKQRLYIHSYGKGQYFDLVKNQLVVPTQGDSYVEE